MSLEIKSQKNRKIIDLLVKILSALGAFIGLFFLMWIILEVLIEGIGALNWDFFTKLPTPPGMEGGGLANAILGTVLLTLLGALIGTPAGLLTGVYLAEYGKGSKFAASVRFLNNALIGIPSIIIGVFVYTLMVVPAKTFSSYAGAVSLALIMYPVVVRATEDMLNMVPDTLRESGLALGLPRWRVTLNLIFRAAKSGLLTGVLLAVARISGETAPLLFTALNSQYWISSLREPVANLTVTIFNYAMSPYDDWIAKAWGASFLIMAGVLFITVIARYLLSRKKV
jgi:phosphate transport system permease protein